MIRPYWIPFIFQALLAPGLSARQADPPLKIQGVHRLVSHEGDPVRLRIINPFYKEKDKGVDEVTIRWMVPTTSGSLGWIRVHAVPEGATTGNLLFSLRGVAGDGNAFTGGGSVLDALSQAPQLDVEWVPDRGVTSTSVEGALEFEGHRAPGNTALDEKTQKAGQEARAGQVQAARAVKEGETAAADLSSSLDEARKNLGQLKEEAQKAPKKGKPAVEKRVVEAARDVTILGEKEKAQTVRLQGLQAELAKANEAVKKVEQAEAKLREDAALWPGRHSKVLTLERETDSDRNFRLRLFSGVTYLQSREDFSKAFPELLLVVDSYFFCSDKQMGTTPRYFVEGHAELGLTSTGVGTQPAPAGQTASDPGSRAVIGLMGIGFGRTFTLPGTDEDTRRISFQIFHTFGVQTVPHSVNQPAGGNFNQTFWGLKIRNEDGHFAGAYLAFGYGRSEQYRDAQVDYGSGPVPLEARFVSRRFKADGFLPLTSAKHMARIALRIQVDQADDPWSNSRGGQRPGDTKISLLVPVDIFKFVSFLKGEGGS